ncbi:LptF/LptG family permease [Flavitalea sp. BT771]|uniref:LptF/LptG family permease n=1 Tax=Flavitalea sp. BT771 TaxID=3063329 RepID=UPI0026E22C80|nr:LptF/LptG family permease [Flavitalea sp. BT771]MDO6433137.1 LptF/LptG family permease [Flavitalea sp. BT771]MDV6221587.1 LptF/LptG family permease [Flavitalea sp. BT771]
MPKSPLKKLDLLIIKAFVGPFIATFFITLFVLVLQFFWLYIDDIVGKGVDMITVARLILYVSATLVPLALPLAVLLSSIMTLGNLGETFELIAIKSAGISLLRFMRPLFFISLVICYVAFLFNNNIIPVANLKMNTLKYDIIVSKPAFDIKEGVFYDKIEGYVIKIGKKEKDDSTIRSVVIYQQNYSGQQDDIIIAEKGKMVVTPDKHSLMFVLQNGWIYQEGKGDRMSTTNDFIRMGFKEYTKILDLSSFKLNKTEDSAFKNNYQMLTMTQLGRNIDSLKKQNEIYRKRAATDLSNGLKFSRMLDTTGWAEVEKLPKIESRYLLAKASLPTPPVTTPVGTSIPPARPDTSHKDSTHKDVAHKDSTHKDLAHRDSTRKDSTHKDLAHNNANHKDTSKHPTDSSKLKARSSQLTAQSSKPPPPPPDPTLRDYLPDSTRSTVVEHAISALSSVKIQLDQPAFLYGNQENELVVHRIAWHEKLTLSVACLVMFLIGAPLGSIIRKGGIGMPLIFAVVFFVIFFLLNNFGKKFAKEDVLTPFGGMWMATYVLTPIGIFLVYKALHDSQLFNKEFYFRMAKAVRLFFQRLRRKETAQS